LEYKKQLEDEVAALKAENKKFREENSSKTPAYNKQPAV